MGSGVTAHRRSLGHEVNPKRVQRLMPLMGLEANRNRAAITSWSPPTPIQHNRACGSAPGGSNLQVKLVQVPMDLAGKSIHPFRVALVIPTLDPGVIWTEWLEAFQKQTLRPEFLWIVDSDSQDGYPQKSISCGFILHKIRRSDFSHGGTRQWVVEQLSDADIVVFMTQDAIFADSKSLSNLIDAFNDPSIAAAYGRQLPRKGASPIEAYARIFSYPNGSRIKSISDAPELGIKTAFFSNSFGAFRRSALLEIGGFPARLNFCEDVYAASKLLLKGWKIAYVSGATVFHSHDYSLWEEFQRYIRVGAFYGSERWIVKTFGMAEKEGKKLIMSELGYLIPRHIELIPSALFRSVLKLIGYRIGEFQSRRKDFHQDQ